MSSVPGGSSVRRAGADEPLDLARPVPQQGSGAARTDDQVDGVFPCALRDQREGVEVHPVHQVGPSAPPLPSMVQGGEVDDLEARDPFLGRVEVEPQYGAAPEGPPSSRSAGSIGISRCPRIPMPRLHDVVGFVCEREVRRCSRGSRFPQEPSSAAGRALGYVHGQ